MIMHWTETLIQRIFMLVENIKKRFTYKRLSDKFSKDLMQSISYFITQ